MFDKMNNRKKKHGPLYPYRLKKRIDVITSVPCMTKDVTLRASLMVAGGGDVIRGTNSFPCDVTCCCGVRPQERNYRRYHVKKDVNCPLLVPNKPAGFLFIL